MITGYKVFLSSSSKAKKLPKLKSGESCVAVIEPEDFTADEVKTLKEKGYKVLGYISVGTISDERPEDKELEQYELGPVDDWPHEQFVDLRRTVVRDFIVKRAKSIKKLGCDGYWCDNIDIYENYKSPAMYTAVTSVLRRIKALGGYVMLNGGYAYLQKAMDDEEGLGSYKVQSGAFGIYENAEARKRELAKNGIKTIIKEVNGLYKIQAGAFSKFSNAYATLCGIFSIDIPATIILEGASGTEAPIRTFIDGVTQEEVFTRIKNYDGKGAFGSQVKEQSNLYKEHMVRLEVHGVGAWLLEYTGSASMVKKIKDFVRNFSLKGYYCSSDVNL